MRIGIEVLRGAEIERITLLRMETIARYRYSRSLLGDAPEVQRIVGALETSAFQRPHAGTTIPGTIVRVLHATRYGRFPALRLYYCVAGTAVHFLWIEHYDEMEP
jgi:hypothetical protein